MARMEQKDYDCEVVLMDSTPASYKVRFDHVDDFQFVPKSQCEYEETGRMDETYNKPIVHISIRGWLADKNGWRY